LTAYFTRFFSRHWGREFGRKVSVPDFYAEHSEALRKMPVICTAKLMADEPNDTDDNHPQD
jgi:hypothetical protein